MSDVQRGARGSIAGLSISDVGGGIILVKDVCLI